MDIMSVLQYSYLSLLCDTLVSLDVIAWMVQEAWQGWNHKTLGSQEIWDLMMSEHICIRNVLNQQTIQQRYLVGFIYIQGNYIF